MVGYLHGPPYLVADPPQSQGIAICNARAGAVGQQVAARASAGIFSSRNVGQRCESGEVSKHLAEGDFNSETFFNAQTGLSDQQ